MEDQLLPEFLSRINHTICRESLFTSQDVLIVGISGGADSVALLLSLHRLGYRVVAAHCNFNLRGAESVRDQNFCKLVSSTLGVPYHEIEFETTAYAKTHGISIEMACRELRYEWFESLLKELNAHYIVVGHHQDDQIETFFLNLLRGTGIAGLTGMAYKCGHLVRPLLDVNRVEIDEYLQQQGIEHVTDSSNFETIYKRNQIRIELIPLLETIQPSARKSILRTMSNLQQVEQIYQKSLQDSKAALLTSKGEELYLNIEVLEQEDSPRTVLFECLREFGVRPKMLPDLMKAIHAISGKVFYTDTHQIVKDRDHLIVSPLPPEEQSEIFLIHDMTPPDELPIRLEMSELGYFPGFVFPREKEVACIDLSKVSFPLILRRWKQGDRFKPLGLKGFKKVSDYFSNEKLSLIDKQKAWIMESNGEIIWIVNYRVDERVKVTSDTEKVLFMRVNY